MNRESLPSFKTHFYFPLGEITYLVELPLGKKIDENVLVVIGEGPKKGEIYRFSGVDQINKQAIFKPIGEVFKFGQRLNKQTVHSVLFQRQAEVEAQGYFLARRFNVKM